MILCFTGNNGPRKSLGGRSEIQPFNKGFELKWSGKNPFKLFWMIKNVFENQSRFEI